MIRVFEAFAGYGSQSLALQRLKEDYEDFDYEVVGISEIDRYAIQAYKTIHGDVPNYGDITAMNWYKVPDFDLLTWSSPCQDISLAGHGKGMVEDSGTRSSLLWEVRKPATIKKPKYILFENVKNFIGSKNVSEARRLFSMLESLGYTVFYKVLNSKDYGVPQNRERIYIVAILNVESYEFPHKFRLEKRLKDVLEQDVDEKYYLNPKALEKLTLNLKESSIGINYIGNTNKGGERGAILSDKGICSTLSATDYKQPKQIAVAVEPLNDQDGMYRTIKSQYYKNSAANFIRQGSMGATGVLDARIFEVGKINSSQDGVVVNPNGIVPCLTSGHGNCPKVIEPIPIDDYNSRIPEDKDVVGTVRQTFGSSAPRNGWKLLEPQIIKAGNYHKSGHNASSVVSPEGIAPTVMENHGTVTAVIEKKKIIEPNTICLNSKVTGKQPSVQDRIYSVEEVSTAITTAFRPSIAEPKILEAHFGNTRLQSLVESGKIKGDRVQFLDAYNQSVNDDVAGTIRTTIDSSNMHFITEPFIKQYPRGFNPGWEFNLCPAITTSAWQNNNFVVIPYENGYIYCRIRKLTPKECFRLMGVSENDIEKIQAAGISNSQQYKLAGNSIVVDVLYYIFKNLFIGYEKTTLF